MSTPTDDRASGFTDTLYASLCEIAEATLRRSRPPTAILPAELVHDCYLKLEAAGDVRTESSVQFRALAATMIRQVLVDRVRARRTLKRGDGWEHVSLHEIDRDPAATVERVDLLGLDEAIRRLASLDARQARIVELRFFGGLSIQEVAAAIDVSPRTVDEDWRFARAWLRRAIG